MLGVSIDRVQRWLTRDYLPFLRPYLRWTRQPVTWLLLAAVATLLCGLVLQPRAFWLCGLDRVRDSSGPLLALAGYARRRVSDELFRLAHDGRRMRSMSR